MPDRKLNIELPVRGELDTAMPITDRPYGTLVEAKDVNPRVWGPKAGSQAFTRVWEGPGTASLYDQITLNGTNNARAQAKTYEDAFGDLGTTFTLDLWIRPAEFGYAAAFQRIGVYAFTPGASGAGIDVNIYGGAHPSAGKLEVVITTSPTRTTAAAGVTIAGATALLAGGDQLALSHVRVVRDGKNAYVYLNGVLDGSSTSLSQTNPINRDYGSYAVALLGYSSTANISFKGDVYGAVLRDGVFRSEPISSVMPGNAWGRNVHHYYLGHNLAFGGSDPHFMDAGRFAAHARVIYTGGGDYTITAANNNSAPAPTPVQGLQSWATKTNKTATSVMAGGILSTTIVS